MRKQNWPYLLSSFIEDRINKPFEWGINDCCLFAADAVEIITGVDYAADYRGKYRSAIGARRILGKYGYTNMAEACSNYFHEIFTDEITRGDLILVNIEKGNEPYGFLGVFFNNRIWAMSYSGAITISKDRAAICWRVV